MEEKETAAVPVKSKRDLFGERLKKKYPDREYADDEALFGQVNDDYDAYEKDLEDYKEREKRITDLFYKDPRSARFITDMANGEDPFINVIKRLGIDGVTDLLNDPSKQEEYAQANAAFLERIAKSKELEEEYQKNFAESCGLLDRVQEERGLDDATMDAAADLLRRIADEAIVGKISVESIDMALKALGHDADVAAAHDEGMVAGRNSKIAEKLRKPKGGDGTPQLAGSNNAATAPVRKPMNIFDYADAAS